MTRRVLTRDVRLKTGNVRLKTGDWRLMTALALCLSRERDNFSNGLSIAWKQKVNGR